jgi:hypothetical protein
MTCVTCSPWKKTFSLASLAFWLCFHQCVWILVPNELTLQCNSFIKTQKNLFKWHNYGQQWYVDIYIPYIVGLFNLGAY